MAFTMLLNRRDEKVSATAVDDNNSNNGINNTEYTKRSQVVWFGEKVI